MTIKNNIIPFKGFVAMAMWPFIFVRKDCMAKYNIQRQNHEKIHLRQQLEMLVVFFYLWYAIEYLIRLVQYRDFRKAYRNISFEREAYANDEVSAYLKYRCNFSFVEYI